MFGLFGQRKNGVSPWPWQRTPESGLNLAVDRFLALTAQIADDAAVALDADLRRLIDDLAPAEAECYASIVRVPGAFPPYLAWASLAALGDEPIGRVLDPDIARRVEARFLESAALVRGKSNARLLSAILYRVSRAGAAGQAPIDALVPRFLEEVQRMEALSAEGCEILSASKVALKPWGVVLRQRCATSMRVTAATGLTLSLNWSKSPLRRDGVEAVIRVAVTVDAVTPASAAADSIAAFNHQRRSPGPA